MKVPFLDLKTQYKTIKDELDEELNWVLDNTSFILGEKVSNFETNFASYCDKKHAIALNSGTSALHLALISMGIKPGDEVITVPNTFIATVSPIAYIGAKPVFVDVEPKTFNMDVNKIKDAITSKTKAIIPVHLYGQPADMEIIREIAEKHDLKIIEDACQAHGAEYKGKKVPVTNIGCFSFYPGKNLGAYGEGGAVVTDDAEAAEKIRMLRDHGQPKKYYHKYIGYNYRMDGFQGAVLNVKLKYLDQWINGRRKAAKLYNELLNKIVDTPKEASYSKHVYHLYVIRLKEREQMMAHLNSKDIATGLHYPIPLHLQEAYLSMGLKKGAFPVTEAAANEILSLPMYPEISEEQINYVCSSIKEFLKPKS